MELKEVNLHLMLLILQLRNTQLIIVDYTMFMNEITIE